MLLGEWFVFDVNIAIVGGLRSVARWVVCVLQ